MPRRLTICRSAPRNPFAGSDQAIVLGMTCLMTGNRPRDVLRWTDTEREMAGVCAMAVWQHYTEFWTKMYEAVYSK